MILPRKLVNYSIFARGGREYLGLADVVMPNIQNLTDTYKGAGVFGEVEVPIQCHMQAAQVTLNWHIPTAEGVYLYIQDGCDLDCWGALQHVDSSNNRIVHRGVRLQMLTMPAGFDFGTFEVGASTSSTTTFQVTRIRVSFEEKEALVIDVDNQIFSIEGVDYMGSDTPVNREIAMLTEPPVQRNGEVTTIERIEPTAAQPDLLKDPITVHLLSPVEQDGKTISEITLNFAGLTDEDWDYCERTWRAMIGTGFEMDFMSRTYQRIVAARAGDFPLMLFKQLKGADNRRLTSLAFNFLGRCSVAETPES